MSQLLIKANFVFRPLINGEFLNNLLNQKIKLQLGELRCLYELADSTLELRKLTYLDFNFHALQMNLVAGSKNISHLLGLYLFRTAHVPMKLDLFMRGFHTQAEIREVLLANGVNATEASDIESLLLRSGSWNTLYGITRMWRQHGYI